MKHKKSYQQWLEYRNRVSSIQEAIYFSLGILSAQSENDTPYIGGDDGRVMELLSLLDELNGFAESKCVHKFNCTEVDSSFLDEFKIFARLRQVDEDSAEIYQSFLTMHLIFIVGDVFNIPGLDLDMFEKWMCTNFMEFDK